MSSGGTTTTVNQPAPKTAEEIELDKINLELAKKQLANVDALAPFQQELITSALKNLNSQNALDDAISGAVTPEQQAAAYKAEFERAQRLGPIQDELLQMQLDDLRRGGAATPEQEARIKAAADAGIEAGSADIDASTGRGIGLIADELANARGLRLSDSPIKGEAAFLAREGEIQKGSLVKNLRAGEAAARLNFPLAAQQIQSGINLNQQSITAAAAQFNADLRQRAYQNRLALTGQTSQSGIGLASIQGGGIRNDQPFSSTTSSKQGIGLAGIGALASGVGALAPFFKTAGAAAVASDRRLKHDYGVVARTEGGIDLHLFRYKGESDNDPLRLGVMADEAEKVVPDAVRRHSSGYKVVRYDMIS